MRKEEEKLFSFSRLSLIIIIVVLLILIIAPLLFSSLSTNPNEYTKGLNNLKIKENECINDSGCTHNNTYCYIGKCLCIEGWAGEPYCNISLI
jgi:hypothetical protein